MRDRISFYLGRFLALLMAVMTLDVLWGVFTRYAMGAQASWSEELARFLLIWIGILGAAYVSGQKAHLAINLISSKISAKADKRLNLFVRGLVIVFALFVLVIGGSRLIYISQILGQLSPALRIPMSVVYGVVPLSGLFIIYFKLTETYQPAVE